MAGITRRHATVELADGRILEVRVTNPDTIRYEQAAQKYNWPKMTVNNGTATLADSARRATFEAWAALKRTNQYTESYDQFAAVDCLDVSLNEEEVPPTPSEPDSDSWQKSPGTENDLSLNSVPLTTS